MKKISGYLLSLFTMLNLNVFSQSLNDNPSIPDHFPNCVFYEIFVRSFYDSNGDSTGDLKGIAQKLDYLQSLGIEGLWITPINPSPSYHKYDVTDYYSIDKEYGTLAGFKNLLAEAHKRDIKVIIDMVINHCSSHHHWFKEAIANPSGPYRDYFVWKKPGDITTEKEHWYVRRGSKAQNIQQVKRFNEGEQAYYAFFWGEMPDFNYDNRLLRDEMIKIGKFWLKDAGVDGFRLDAAKWIYPPGNEEKNYIWWREYTAALREVKPDAFFAGEVTDSFTATAPYMKDALNSVFNFDLGPELIPSLREEKDSGIAALVSKTRFYFSQISPSFIDATFLTNHDQNRIASELNNNEKKIKLAASILLTLPGSPFIYYGEEIGMNGMKPDENIREPFLWDIKEKDKGRCKWMPPVYSTDKTVVPLALQMDDTNSIYHHYKTLIALRNSEIILRLGPLDPVALSDNHIIAFVRRYADKVIYVFHNIGGTSKTIPVKQFDEGLKILYSSDTSSVFRNADFILAPYSTVLFRPDDIQH